MGKLFSNGHRYDHFEPEEFHCPCCGKEEMQHSTMSLAEEVRHRYGKPLRIPEGGGWRCDDYDSTYSAHKDGHGIDASYPREDHFTLLKLAFEVGFTGIGDKNIRDEDGNPRWQMHWDDAPDIPGKRPRPWKWTYDT